MRSRPILISSFLTAALLLGGCGFKTYTHDEYAGGQLVRHYQVQISEPPLMDFQAKSSRLRLPDGAVWDLSSPDVKADPNAMAVAQSWGAAALTAAGTIAKLFVGVP